MRWIVLSFLTLLAACGLPEDPAGSGQAVPPQQDPALLIPCGADTRANLIGMTLEELMRVEILGPVRVIRPGDPVTEDFFAQRLNIYLTATDTVSSISCG